MGGLRSMQHFSMTEFLSHSSRSFYMLSGLARNRPDVIVQSGGYVRVLWNLGDGALYTSSASVATGVSTSAARIETDDERKFAGWRLSLASFVVAALGTWVTEKIVIPRLGRYGGDKGEIKRTLEPEFGGPLHHTGIAPEPNRLLGPRP